MRKKSLFISTLIMAVSMMFVSCEKAETTLDERLVGTKWKAKDIVYEVIFGGKCYDVYEFISATEVENYVARNGEVDYVYGTYKYTLNYPNITIHEVNSEGERSDLKFVFQDTRTMIRENMDSSFEKYIRE